VRQAILALALLLPGAHLSAYAQSSDQSSGQSQSGPSAQSSSPTAAPASCNSAGGATAASGATTNCPQTPAKPADTTSTSQAKSSAKPHKVLTNDDIDARPHDVSVQGLRDVMQQINTCDRTCFDQVAQRAGVTGGYSPKWKVVLLESVEIVKGDSTWQGILGELLRVQEQSCETQVRKTEDLRKYTDSRSVTSAELAIERQYEPRFRELHNRLNAGLDRANTYINGIAPGNVQAAYMHMQVDKLVHATCTINVPAPPQDTDDPADP